MCLNYTVQYNFICCVVLGGVALCHIKLSCCRNMLLYCMSLYHSIPYQSISYYCTNKYNIILYCSIIRSYYHMSLQQITLPCIVLLFVLILQDVVIVSGVVVVCMNVCNLQTTSVYHIIIYIYTYSYEIHIYIYTSSSVSSEVLVRLLSA